MPPELPRWRNRDPNSHTPDANFRARRERQIGWSVQPDKHNEGAARLELNRPQPPTTFTDQPLKAIRHRIAFFPNEWRWKELHDTRVGVELGERGAIRRTPLAQKEPLRGRPDHVRHSWHRAVVTHAFDVLDVSVRFVPRGPRAAYTACRIFRISEESNVDAERRAQTLHNAANSALSF